MTSRLVTVQPQASVTAVAQKMRDESTGAVLVIEDEELRELVSDRDRRCDTCHACGQAGPALIPELTRAPLSGHTAR
ncbi:CBS domain-containing protein [Streptomyces bungoensis]|uniref:CBS domain-containing protein n=1 Tax=Streptomyces bungoensis TaxID=285568 RepID=UPI0033CC433C